MKTTISLGFVHVHVPEYDCEGTQRTIDFPYVGRTLYGAARYHASVSGYVKDAHKVARAALHAAVLDAEYDRIAMRS